jgi:hypothetical protein
MCTDGNRDFALVQTTKYSFMYYSLIKAIQAIFTQYSLIQNALINSIMTQLSIIWSWYQESLHLHLEYVFQKNVGPTMHCAPVHLCIGMPPQNIVHRK